MRRSHSYNSLRNSDLSDQEDEDDNNSLLEDVTTKNSRGFSILRMPSKNARNLYVNFSASCVILGTPAGCLEIIRKYRLGYKFMKTECKLVRNILHAHGFKETQQNSINFNLMWSGSHLKPYTLRTLKEHQKVNHFPRSYELTRKDRLYKNIQRMQHSKGVRHFDFIPQSYVLPSELNDFYSAFLKDRGPWIVKPCALSRGRGIYLVNHVKQIPLEDNVLVCRYINNPLLINGFKFDCRIYVAVTSYDPLRIYIYEEGLARFSTVKYESGNSVNLKNQWMHLTNYSLNKHNEDYIRCDDPEVDNYGSKWSLSAMLRHLKEHGEDTRALMARIEDVIIKTIISGEMAIATACKMFVPFSGNCFELFGFDILIDEKLKPWLLEVNLSPSLACDAPMDLKIKSNLISDLFNLTGFMAEDPALRRAPRKNSSGRPKQRLQSANYTSAELRAQTLNKLKQGVLNKEERKYVWDTRQEFKNKGGFVRVYPSPESWELYSSLQDHHTTSNRMLHSQLFPNLWSTSTRPQSATYIARARNISSMNKPVYNAEACIDLDEENYHQRYLLYERKMAGWDSQEDTRVSEGERDTAVGPRQPRLVQGDLTMDGQYESKLVKPSTNYTVSENVSRIVEISEISKNAQHLSKFQAREAFAVYLQRVQHRLLQEIGQSKDNQPYRINIEEHEKQEHQINLIHRFLMKAAVNLSNPINIILPHQNLPLLERKKILARQLNDFIKVYKKETSILLQRSTNENDQNDDIIIDEKSFNTFIAISSEQELEEILTVYTKHNKSASIFLGAKSTKSNGSARSRSARPVSDTESKTSERRRRVPSASDGLARPKFASNSLQKTSAAEKRDTRPHSRSNSEPSSKLSNSSLRCSSAVSASTRDTRSYPRQYSANSIRRSASRESVDKIHTMVCTYTGSTRLLQHQQKRDFPKMKDALRQFSSKQSYRTYSARQYSNSSSNSAKKTEDERDEAIEKYKEFLKKNEKYFVDDGVVGVRRYGDEGGLAMKRMEPRPPVDKKPELKKQLSSQRTFRTIVKK